MPWLAWATLTYLVVGMWMAELAVDNEWKPDDDAPHWVWVVAVLAVMLGWPLIVWASVRGAFDK